MTRWALLFVLLLGGQGLFWQQTHDHLPDMTIVPDVPGEAAVKALSLGDEQAFFRLLGLQLQNAGDTFGRFTALYKYDFKKLSRWFALLDTLDHHSDYIPTMATYYFAQTQHVADVSYVVDYLEAHSAKRPAEKWWWLTQAVYLANHKLEDKDRALEVVRHLEGVEGIPLWAQQMPAFVYEQHGEMDAAAAIISHVLEHQDEISPGELNFMRYFVEERIQRLDEMGQQLKEAEQRQTTE